MPQVVLSDLGGEVVHDDALFAILVRQTLFEREEKKRKEKEVETRMKDASKSSLRLGMHGQVPHWSLHSGKMICSRSASLLVPGRIWTSNRTKSASCSTECVARPTTLFRVLDDAGWF